MAPPAALVAAIRPWIVAEPAVVAKPAAPPPDLTAAKTPATAPRPVEATSRDSSMSRRAWGWTVGGTGLVVVGVGALFGLQAKAAIDAEKKASADGDLATYQKKKYETKQKAMLADVCFVAGGVAAGIGTYLLLTGSSSVAVAPTEGGLLASYSGRF
jgi:hypothetical protein